MVTIAGVEQLGPTQVLVLRLLALGDKSARDLAYHWPSLTESSARSALNRLGDKRLVEGAGFDENRRTYCLTHRGAEVEGRLNSEEA